MVKSVYTVAGSIVELVNVPFVDGTKIDVVYAVVGAKTVGKRVHGSTSGEGVVKNHRVTFEKEQGRIGSKVKMNVERWLRVQFVVKHGSSGHDEVLGVVHVDLVGLAKDKVAHEMRVLLDESKTNTVVKMVFQVKGAGEEMGELDDVVSTPVQSRPQKVSNVRVPVAKVSEDSLSASTHTMMIKACELAMQETSLLDELLNNTYRFTWQVKSHLYKEFTPTECVRDIVERNGNGWKKNEEGLDMIDVVEAEEVEKMRVGDKRWLHGDDDDEDDEDDGKNLFAEFDEGAGVDGEDDEDNESESEVFDLYYRSRRRSRATRLKPLTESEVREDLRSWNITV